MVLIHTRSSSGCSCVTENPFFSFVREEGDRDLCLDSHGAYDGFWDRNRRRNLHKLDPLQFFAEGVLAGQFDTR
jgi:hypothetical protein